MPHTTFNWEYGGKFCHDEASYDKQDYEDYETYCLENKATVM